MSRWKNDWIDRAKILDAGSCDPNAHHRSCSRKKQAFNQQIPNDSRTAATQCCSESEILLSFRAAAQEQTGNVDACDQQNHSNSREQRQQSQTQVRAREKRKLTLQVVNV